MPSSLIVPGGRPPAEQPAPAPQPEVTGPVPVEVAFTVYQTAEGYWRLADIDTEMQLARKVTFDDMTGAAAVILRESEPGLTYPDGPLVVSTAYVLFQLPTGLWQVADDLAVPVQPRRTPIGDDIVAGLTVSARDAATQEIAGQVVPNTAQVTLNNLPQAMMQFGNAIREQAESGNIAAALQKERAARGAR